ncbi:hypothetical protein MTO96_011975 [Rhipicephalus appendiculatus]
MPAKYPSSRLRASSLYDAAVADAKWLPKAATTARRGDRRTPRGLGLRDARIADRAAALGAPAVDRSPSLRLGLHRDRKRCCGIVHASTFRH